MAAILVLVAILNTIAAAMGWISVSPLYSDLGGVILCTLMVGSALRAYFHPLHTQSSIIAYFIIPFHGVAFFLPILVTGFISPMTMFWVVLIVVTGILISKKAMLYSGALFTSSAIVCLAFVQTPSEIDIRVVSEYLGYAMVINILAWFVSSLRDIQAAEHKDFVKMESTRTTEQNQLLTLINSLNEAVISVNKKGAVQLYNAATLSLLDTNQSLNGKSLDEVFSLLDEKDEVINLFDQLESGSPSQHREDMQHLYPDGNKISLSISSSRIRSTDNETEGYILVIRDITRNKSLNEERDEFIAVVSHELRTPVAITEGTISNLQLLIKKGASPSKVIDALETAHDETLYLSKMINDLSTLSRAERNVGSEKEIINVQEFVHEIYKEYQSKAARKGLTLNLDITSGVGYIKASRLYLEEIIQNFLTNAIKYTPSGHVDFIVKSVKDSVLFSVKDSGIGINKSEHKKIFEKFYRSEDYRTRETKGTGLGLYIVQKLAHKLSTQVELESRLNHGSTFSIRIPASRGIDNKAIKP